jgi:serine/threonine protein kinase
MADDLDAADGDGLAPPSADDSARDPLVGRVVAGKYRVVRLLARGGMGRIYEAEQTPLGRIVALKVLDSRYVQSDQDPEFQKRFLLEASTCARLTHPNTVKVYDYGRLEDLADETYFMVMEYIDGRTLRQALVDYGHFPAGRALRVTREIARALREAHRQGVVHRDLKPSNVMLVPSDEGESVKVLDFGIVKIIRDDAGDLTVGGRFLGSPRYMSPEVIRHAAVDPRSDVYSLGVLLYEMLCGLPPFAAERGVQTMMMHLNDPVPPLKARTGVDVAPVVEAIARRCLEKDPAARFPAVDDLIGAIDAAIRELALETQPGPRPSRPAGAAPTGLDGPFPASSTSFPSSATASGGTPMHWQMQTLPPSGPPPGSPPGFPAVAGTGAGRPADERWRNAAFAALVITLVVLLFLVVRRELAAPPPIVVVPAASPSPLHPAATAAVSPSVAVSPSPSVVSPRASVVVVTVPAGAEVVEASRVLGTTPLTLSIDPAELARAPRLLVLRREGYQSQSLELGPVPAGTVLQRTLIRGPRKTR